MGLRMLLAARAIRVAHVLVVEAEGSSRIRMVAEAAVIRRGWQLATSPAEADVLLSCGTPGSELQTALDYVWEQMPGPRARVSAQSSNDVTPALESARRALLDDRSQRTDARNRQTGPPDPNEHATMSHDDSGSGDSGMDMDMDMAPDMDMDMDMDMAPDMDMNMDMDMDMAPDGIALAESGPDTDGLDLDVLHVPLGPVLAHWPAGLVLECTLQGDLIVEADARWLDSTSARVEFDDVDDVDDVDDESSDPRWTAAQYCDDTARLLSVAEWNGAADAARQIRDGLLDAAPVDRCVRELDALAVRVARNRIFGWCFRGITVPGPGGENQELSTLPARWLSAAAAGLDGRDALTSTPRLAAGDVGELVTGLDLASARMVVAGLALHPDENAGAADA